MSYRIVGHAMKVHSTLGPGFLEKVYENSLMIALRKDGINASQQTPVTVFFEQEAVGEYFADILIENRIILELKTVEQILPIHRTQPLSLKFHMIIRGNSCSFVVNLNVVN